MPDARVFARFRLPPPPDLPDADLLARFLDHRDEAAFEALVRRHGPMVRAVCRSQLADPADADDAFQATFLVLVRKAAAVRDRTALGGWLYRVALRVSRKLRAAGAKQVPLPDDVPARVGEASAFDVRRAVDEEIGRLPEKYRVAVQLCYVAGHTTADAARRLGWAKGTVLTRLAWARKRLRARLGRRGVGVAVGSVAVLAARPAAVGAGLVNETVKAAVAVAAGDVLTGRVFNLTEGVVRAMTLNKLKWAASVLLVAVALTGVGVGRWTMNTASAEPGDKKRVTAAEPELPPAKAEPVAAGEAKPGPPAIPGDEPDEKPAAKPRQFVVTKPLGTWVREVTGYGRVTLRFDDDRLYGVGEITADNKRFTVSVEADYGINKESLVFGVVTSVECDEPEIGLELEMLMPGQPFAFRFRADDQTLTVKELKGLGLGLDKNKGDELAELGIFVAGRYTAADAARPVPKAPSKPAPRRPRGAAVGGALNSFGQAPTPGSLVPQVYVGGMILPGAPYPEHTPQYFPPDQPVPVQPVLGATRPRL